MKSGRLLLGIVVFIILIVTLLPVPILVWTSLFDQRYLIVPPENGYTLNWYWALPEEQQLFGSLSLSIQLALMTAFCSTAIGTAAALGVRRGTIKRTGLIEALMTLPLTVPTIVSSMAIYVMLVQIGQMLGLRLIGSFWILLSAHILITLPWTFRVASAGILGINRDLERASLDLGRTGAQTFFRVTLPLLKSTVVSAMVLAFIVSFGDLEMSLFLVAPGETTLPVAMVQYAETRVDPTLAAVAVVQLVIITLLLITANKVFGFGKTFVGGMKE